MIINTRFYLFIWTSQEQQQIKLHYIGPGKQSFEDIPPKPTTYLHSPEERGDMKPVLPLGSAGQARGAGTAQSSNTAMPLTL